MMLSTCLLFLDFRVPAGETMPLPAPYPAYKFSSRRHYTELSGRFRPSVIRRRPDGAAAEG